MALFTIQNGQKPVVNRFDEEEEVIEEVNEATPFLEVEKTPSEYTRSLFKIYGFGVSQMYINLASVALMAILVLISLVSGFKK